MSNTPREKIIAKVVVVYTTATPEVFLDKIHYVYSGEEIDNDMIKYLAKNKDYIYVAAKWGGSGPVYPAYMIESKVPTVAYARISKKDVAAAHGKTRVSKKMADLAFRTLSSILACSYSDDGELY